MAKETNHRRKAKVARKVEELDIEKLSKELIKPKHQYKKNWDKNKGGKPYKKDGKSSHHNKNKGSNKNK